MEYDFKKGNNRPHIYIFDEAWEKKTVALAFSEFVTNQITNGNGKSVTEWHSFLASFLRVPGPLAQALREPQQIISVLEDFSANTDDATITIVNESHLPAHRTGAFAAERLMAGKRAEKLGIMMLKACAAREMESDMAMRQLSDDEVVNLFRKQLDDFPASSDKL
jgi:hypothetical protein